MTRPDTNSGNQPTSLGDMLKAVELMKQHIADACSVPPTFLMRTSYAEKLAERRSQHFAGVYRHHLAKQAVEEGFIEPLFGKMKVILSDHLPKHYECIGHTFRNPPPAKNRSLRLWKKLRYGKGRQYVQPIMQEVEVAFMFDESVLRPALNVAVKEQERRACKLLWGIS